MCVTYDVPTSRSDRCTLPVGVGEAWYLDVCTAVEEGGVSFLPASHSYHTRELQQPNTSHIQACHTFTCTVVVFQCFFVVLLYFSQVPAHEISNVRSSGLQGSMEMCVLGCVPLFENYRHSPFQ